MLKVMSSFLCWQGSFCCGALMFCLIANFCSFVSSAYKRTLNYSADPQEQYHNAEATNAVYTALWQLTLAMVAKGVLTIFTFGMQVCLYCTVWLVHAKLLSWLLYSPKTQVAVKYIKYSRRKMFVGWYYYSRENNLCPFLQLEESFHLKSWRFDCFTAVFIRATCMTETGHLFKY